MTEINKIFKKLQETLEASSSKVINRTFSEKKNVLKHTKSHCQEWEGRHHYGAYRFCLSFELLEDHISLWKKKKFDFITFPFGLLQINFSRDLKINFVAKLSYVTWVSMLFS